MKLNLFFSTRVQQTILAASLGLALLPESVNGFPMLQWMQGGHSAKVTGVAGSPDGSMIATSSEDGTVKVWTTNGTLLRTLSTQPNPATAVAWSPDGRKIVAGTYYGGNIGTNTGQGLVYLWQAPGGAQANWAGSGVTLASTTLHLYGKVTTLAFTPDGTELAYGGAEGSNVVRRVSDWASLASRQAYDRLRTVNSPSTTYYNNRPAAVTSVAFSPANWMLSGCEDGTARLYDSSFSELVFWTFPTNVTGVAFSPDGSLVALASLDQTNYLYSTSDWSMQTLVHTNGVTSVAFSPDGSRIVTGCMDGTIRVWNTNGSGVFAAAAHSLPVNATLFSADGSLVISGSDDGTARLWSAVDGSPVCTLGGRSSFIGAVAVSPNGTLCASAGGEHTIQVRNTSDGSLVQTLYGNTNYVSSLAFSPDSARLASGGGPQDPTIKIWTISDGALLRTILATTNGVMALAWSPDGLTLAAGGDSVEQNITFWNTNGVLQGTLAGEVTWHTNGVTALAFSSQGNLLASGGRRPGNIVRVWTNSTPGGVWTSGTAVQNFWVLTNTPDPLNNIWNNVECLAFSPDGTRIAFGGTAMNVLNVGRLSDGTSVTLGSSASPVYSVAFSAGGLLAAASQNSVGFWFNNGLSWSLIATATQETVRASSLAFSPNGLLLCGREDGTVAMLQVMPLGAASNPSPSDGASGIPVNVILSWTPGVNAVMHAVYLGYSSNAVAHATPASPELQGFVTGNSLAIALYASSAYYWRVDEVVGNSATIGSVWSFTTTATSGLAHRYTFSETGGTSVADSAGGPDWTGTLPNGGTFANDQLTLASNLSQHVSLPAGMVSSVSNFTIEAWLKLNTTTASARLFDFGNGTGDYMMFVPFGTGNRMRFETVAPGYSPQTIVGTNALSVGVWHHLAVTLSGTTGILYVNGIPMGTNSSMTINPSLLGSTTNNFFGRSQNSNHPYFNGVIDEFRIYNEALTPAAITATHALGPSQPLTTNSPSLSLGTTQTNLTLTWPVSSFGFALQSRTNLTAGTWVSVSSPAPQMVGTNYQIMLTLTNAAQFFRLSK